MSVASPSFRVLTPRTVCVREAGRPVVYLFTRGQDENGTFGYLMCVSYKQADGSWLRRHEHPQEWE